MKYHSTLLKKYISVNETPEHISKNLIVKTCEIEEIIERNISDLIVIGQVTSWEKHPEADKLNVCQVNCGDKGTYQIICGGENVRANIYVPVALPGTVFKKIGMTIEKRKMRGLESNGMICSKEELDINEDLDKHNIRDLKEDLDDIGDADLGTPLVTKYPRLNSYVLDVENKCLTNRPDLTGHFGIATELNAMYTAANEIIFNKIPDRYKQFKHTNILEILENATPAKRKVISKTEGLRTYTMIEINNISLQQTSFFTRLQMIDMGANPRNNRVDFSNLFMLLSGQPIHFFDADKVDGDLIIRNATEGEEFIDLFETTHILKSSDIVIADKTKILALAGVVGGLHSGISESTKNILVEIANFDPVAVRKTGTRLALRTDAELRFEKHINPRWSLYCLLLFLDELKYYNKDLGNFDIGGIASYISPALAPKEKTITCDFTRMGKYILVKSEKDFANTAKNILERVGFGIQENTITCPIRRSPDDLNITADITEEVARIYGYDNIDPLQVTRKTHYQQFDETISITRTLEEELVKTFHSDQTETYPRISEKQIQTFHGTTEHLYSLKNPVNPDAPYMRDSMVYGLLANISKNSKFFDECSIFDIGKVWTKNNTEKERMQMGIMLYKKNISSRSEDLLVTAKKMLPYLLKHIGIHQTSTLEITEYTAYHPKKQANILIDGERIGYLGMIHPLLLKANKIPETAQVMYIEREIEACKILRNNQSDKQTHYETLQDQIIWRDLCFVLDTETSYKPIIEAINAIPEIKASEVFDLYAGANLGENKKSISLKIKILGNGNSTTEEINAIMDKAITAGEKTGASLRK